MLCWPARTAATDGLAFRAISSTAGNDTRSSACCSACSRASRAVVPQLALQALGFGTGLGVLQRDQRLSSANSVAVCDQNCPDDATLKVLNRLAAPLGFDGAESNRGALEGSEG